MRNLTFGTEAQRRMAERSLELWHLARAHPALAWNGRVVSMTAQVPDPVGLAARLVRLQGATSLHYVPREAVPTLSGDLEALGFATSTYNHCAGGPECGDLADAHLERTALPEGLSAHWIDADSPDALVEGLGGVCVGAGVTPACEFAMRGLGPPSAALALCDAGGAVVAGGMSFLCYPPGSPHADQAFWGMLATRRDRRGQGLALFVGASLMRRMADRHGARGYFTGIAPDNAGSERLCARLGVVRGAQCFIGVTDPGVFGSGGITR